MNTAASPLFPTNSVAVQLQYLICFFNTDNDLQGTDGSGSLGGPDVRRQIPIKLLSKQAVRSKPPVRPQRSTGRLLPKGPSGDEGKRNMTLLH